MDCIEKNCLGKINLNCPVTLRTGCAQWSTTHPCQFCGALYWIYGKEDREFPVRVKNRGGKRAFLIEGKLVNKDTAPTDDGLNFRNGVEAGPQRPE